MQVRPGADDDGVDVRVGDQVLPVGVRARDVELAAHGRVDSGRRLQTATISTPSMASKPGMWRARVLAPAPIRPMRMAWVMDVPRIVGKIPILPYA